MKPTVQFSTTDWIMRDDRKIPHKIILSSEHGDGQKEPTRTHSNMDFGGWKMLLHNFIIAHFLDADEEIMMQTMEFWFMKIVGY